MIYLVAILIWIASAWTCQSLAIQKNQDPMLWGCLGFIVGPLAILFIAIASERTPTEQAGGLDQNKICYDCGENIKVAARKCRYCGAEFDDEETQRLVAELQAREHHALELQALDAEKADLQHNRNLAITGVALGLSVLTIFVLAFLAN